MVKPHTGKWDKRAKTFFIFSLLGMLLLVFSVSFIARNSLLQKEIFIVGQVVLLIVSIEHKQKVLEASMLIGLAGNFLAVFSNSIMTTVIAMSIIIVILVAYLYRIGYYHKEWISFIGTVAFVLLAVGYSINTPSTQFLNAFAFGFGAILAALYSTLSLVLYKVRIQTAWIILNVAFAISPLLFLFSHL